MRDYLHKMLKALTSAYTHEDHDSRCLLFPVETNIGKLFSILAWGLNMVQEQSDLIKLWDDIDHAQGSVLDRYGANFGVKRNGMNDAFYRLNIRVKVLAQLSGGDTDTVINAAAELLGVEQTDIDFEDVFPAKIALYVDQHLLTQERLDMLEPIAWAIKRILAAGVGMRLYERTYRTYRYDLLIHHSGAIGTFFRYQPIGEDREATLQLPVAHGGAVVADFAAAPPVGDNKTFLRPVSVAHSGHLPPTLTGVPPNSPRAGRARQSGAGGTYTRTHIKPRRID